MKKAQILGALAVAGALGMVMSEGAWAKEAVAKPSIVDLIKVTNEVEIAAAEAKLAGETKYETYLRGLVEQSVKAQNEYATRDAEDIKELTDALADGAAVTRILLRQAQVGQASGAGEGVSGTVEVEPLSEPETVTKAPAVAKAPVAKTTVKKTVVAVAETEKKITKISAPNTSAGKVVATAASARNTVWGAVSLAVMTFVGGLVMGICQKRKQRAEAEK